MITIGTLCFGFALGLLFFVTFTFVSLSNIRDSVKANISLILFVIGLGLVLFCLYGLMFGAQRDNYEISGPVYHEIIKVENKFISNADGDIIDMALMFPNVKISNPSDWELSEEILIDTCDNCWFQSWRAGQKIYKLVSKER